MYFPKRKTLLLLFLCISVNIVTAQNLKTSIDSLIQRALPDKEGPGAVFLVAQRGKPVYQRATGKANLELNIDLNTSNVFQLGSVTKQFTAIAILMLEEQGKLSVTDRLTKYIPDYPAGDSITIHHLLTHTSGIKDFTKMKEIRDIAQKEMTPEMMVNFFKNEPVDFKPGEKFEYNNSGYVLLGYIIERVSGEPYENFIEQHIFKKAGMTDSRYASDRELIRNRADGYHKKEQGFVNKTVISYSVPFSSGALMSTTADMLKWQNALNQHVLLKAENSSKAFRKYSLNNGEEFTYGYGWHIKDINGIVSREHGGSIFGFKSMAVYIPSQDIYVIGLSNCECNSPTQLVRDIATIAQRRLKDKK
ncbi:MAG: beta-lactamase family protein [Chitinophagaceae bacterium]|nr:beta-lactamase family protein [Chitinophagaceae bacterium]